MSIAAHDGSRVELGESPIGSRIEHNTSAILDRKSKSRKRKRNEEEQAIDLRDWKSFTIKPISGLTISSDLGPTVFEPQCLLPRSNLPLSFIDCGYVPDNSLSSKFFSANISILNQLDGYFAGQPTILIAQCPTDRRCFAVERVLPGLFTICPLAPWVTLPMVHGLQNHEGGLKKDSKIAGQHAVSFEAETWWQTASVSRRNQLPVPLQLATEVKCGFGHSHPKSDPLKGHRVVTVDLEDGRTAGSEEDIVPHVLDDPLQDPKESLDAIRSQYQEALYASKAPLTYFAKGPLSRARSCFDAHDGSSRDCCHLTNHLRSLLLSVSMLDKKYRDTIPNVLKELPFSVDCEDDGASILASVKKTRKSKKTALRKNALYPNEEIDLTRWWLSKDIADLPCDTEDAREECARNLLQDQRSRETQLQIILLLETLALEASMLDRQNMQEVTVIPPTAEKDGTQTKRPKKPQDLHTLLDLLVDRLSIWQTMALEETRASKDTPKANTQPETVNIKSKDRSLLLYQFCVDVVLPFFGARLPEKAKVLCQKLGGPKDPSPKRPALVKSATIQSRLVKPGASIRRAQVQRSRKTLERVLTDDKPTHRKHPPSFSRSATEPSLPQLKREVSDVTLSSVPAYQVSKRFGHREVDLRVASQATETKVKKKAQIEKELQGAIAALKKPNARMAVKEFVDAADKRVGDSRCRKPTNPKRNPFAAQVMATPSKDRQMGTARLLPSFNANYSAEKQTDNHAPSSVSRVPCSTTKPLNPSCLLPGRPVADSGTNCEAESTPTRGSARFTARPAASAVLSRPNMPSSNISSGTRMAATEPSSLSPKLPVHPAALRDTPANTNRSFYSTEQSMGDTRLGVQATPIKGQKILTLSENALNSVILTQVIEPLAVHDDDYDDVDLL